MVTAHLPLAGKRLRLPDIGKAALRIARRLRPAKSEIRGVAAKIAQIPFTFAGIGCVDYGFFHWCSMAGWIVTGISLFVMQELVADE